MNVKVISRIFRAIVIAILTVCALIAVWYFEPDPGDDAPKVLVSVDRTFWNRAGFNRWTYIRALRKVGLRPILVDFTSLPPNPDSEAWLDDIDGLLLSGGGDVSAAQYGGDTSVNRAANPARDAFELQLLAEADERGMPMLGLCRGAQLLNVFHGGTLGDFRADSPRYRRHKKMLGGHDVNIEGGTRLESIYSARHLDEVVTWHGQYVERPGEGVRVTAFAPDGTPEAIEVDSDDPFGMIGVQWHAEVLPWDDRQASLFEAFQYAVDRYQEKRLEPDSR